MVTCLLAVSMVLSTISFAGPYTEPGINGYVDPNAHGIGPDEPDAVLNPVFRGWAISVADYQPAPGVSGQWQDTSVALGPATGSNADIVSLGELSTSQIASGVEPGYIVLTFDPPIRDAGGYEFAIFENAMVSGYNTTAGSVAGQMFGELAYVDVSSDGVNFVRFPGVSLTPSAVGAYGTIEISDIFNLAGKHPNAGGVCTGTPFDLRDVANQPLVLDGTVDVNDIRYVRIVDVPGNGAFEDMAAGNIDPGTNPDWAPYSENHAIYDAWPTYGSGGFDLEAVGVLHEQVYSADINLDGIVDGTDFAFLCSVWSMEFGRAGWINRCDLDPGRDLVINGADMAVFAGQWLGEEAWRLPKND